MRTEFAKTFFLSLLQAKGVFLRSARDGVGCGCGLPYNLKSASLKDRTFKLQVSERYYIRPPLELDRNLIANVIKNIAVAVHDEHGHLYDLDAGDNKSF